MSSVAFGMQLNQHTREDRSYHSFQYLGALLKSGSEREAMSKHKHTVKPGLHVKKRSGHRAFAYQVPPEVADRLPPGINVVLRSFTRDELLALARQAEPQVLRRLMAQPAKNPLEALLLMVEEVYGFLQGEGLPIPHTQQIELAQLLANAYDFSARWPYSRAQMQAAMTPGHPDLRPDLPDEQILVVAQEVEQFLLARLAQESISFRDATQAVYCFPSSRPLSLPNIVSEQANKHLFQLLLIIFLLNIYHVFNLLLIS